MTRCAQRSVKKGSHLGLAAGQRRAGRLHAQLSRELRESDGSELICCWCYICFISGLGGSSVYVPISISLFASVYVSVCLCRSLGFSLVAAARQSVVVVHVSVQYRSAPGQRG